LLKNTISSAQEEKQNGEYSMLLHNEYLKKRKKKDFDGYIKLW
jgi:hypothetical protein